ncbi:uncharacterized protein A4U43_C09F13890 [Asparagus officinalis]|uniref:J domain-containing protein n=1 Tax=Asparagus officinalis TaxID=4686 RepID=A0A5P1EAP0_ASPOF|nr:uncharacterized protein LOC109824056 [Asparagus officinalis]XP_020246167.1 uncharacterized protein LOC109824056 [Asparagus officinalis]XP_020246168.1 uncharacterized protein LOC109824056 [Asparagus officinalis]ONK58517.1 uncharacterized protein A4U43_C09F13890 [Asparagus officinalis]
MECNRDEALRAREIAEKKFTTKDIAGAKKFALKAQNLFPALEGINQMISTLDVYQAAESKINGESDLYAILSLNSLADEETVKKQYRKLALQLHPDKNKSIGAEGAFHLVSEAWSVLSDKNRKLIYDQKRNVKGSQTKVSHPKGKNGFYNFANNSTSNKRSQKSSTASAQSNTFWTSCNRCKMQYEYLRVYLNHNLLCPNCHEAFLAVETGFPSNGAGSNFSWTTPQQNQKKSNRKNPHGSSANLDLHNNPNFQWSAFSRTAGAASETAPSSVAAQAASVVHQTYEKVKREREEAQAAARREEVLRRKKLSPKRSISSSGYYNFGASDNVAKVDRPAKRGRSITEEISEGWKTANFDAGKMRMSSRVSSLSREIDKRNLLMQKAKVEINKKLEVWNSVAAEKLAEKSQTRQKQKQKGRSNVKIVSKPDGGISFMKEPTDNSNIDSSEVAKKSVTIVVPDPEFHDFDKDRLEKSFEGEQVWATYDNEDGMPRFYALIQKVLSLRPFKLRISFLNSKSNSELGPMKWVASGFAKTCGDFRVGRYEVSNTVNIFSHRVRFEKGPRGIVKILPRKGDTWALYKNWSPEWNELTPDNVIYKYDIVEVVDDYNEEKGVLVTPLVKVAGFRAVFHRHTDPTEIKRIPREEMFRFSHQVPSYLLTGDEANNAPKGCCELDPAAIPSDFLQVIAEFEEALETAE